MTPEQILTSLAGRHGGTQLLKCLTQVGAEFLVVGGTALAFHGCRDPAAVDDLDLLLCPSQENAERVVSGLAAAGISFNWSAADLANPAKQVPIKNHPYYAELLTPRDGYDFSEMKIRAVHASASNVVLYVASIGDLILMKRDAVNAPDSLEKHRHDLECLERIQAQGASSLGPI